MFTNAQPGLTGKPIDDPIFTKKQNSLRWSRFQETAPEEMFKTVQQEVFPFIKTLGNQGERLLWEWVSPPDTFGAKKG